jgi:mannan endo-1,4-beta-mannosidase|eukprot:COSAG03_NODE_1288_length_4397_cov_11.788041_5_plen_65_part_00
MPSFYTDQKAIAAFTTFISKRLHHVNPYTKRKAIDEPAIMAWETGNELKPPASWTKQIAGAETS